jgi:hypothetical protein
MVYVVFLASYDYKSIHSIWTTPDLAQTAIDDMEGHEKTEGSPIILPWLPDHGISEQS